MIGLVAGGMFVFARLAGLLMTMPVLGAAGVPPWARLAAALPLTLLLLPAGGAPVPPTLSALLGAVVAEALLGAAMGFCTYVAFSAITIAGDLASAQAGLQMGAMLDPVTLAQPGPLGALAGWLGTGVFLGAGLHLRCIEALGASFLVVPAGGVGAVAGGGGVLAELVGATLVTAICLAGPLTLFLFAVNLALSVVNRMAPGLQLFFAIGTTLQVVAGVVVLAAALPSMLGAWLGGLPAALDAIDAIARLAGG